MRVSADRTDGDRFPEQEIDHRVDPPRDVVFDDDFLARDSVDQIARTERLLRQRPNARNTRGKPPFLRHQRVRVQCDGSHELLQLLGLEGGLPRLLGWVGAAGGQLTSTTSSSAADFQKVGRIVMFLPWGRSMTVVILRPEGSP